MMAPGCYHLIGAAGVGMSPLALALLAAGCRVTGSDRYYDMAALPSGTGGRDLESIRQLQRAGVLFFPQDGRGVTPTTSAIVTSTAIEDDNPDVAAARRLGIPQWHRADALARLLEGRRSVAVTGTSGKSTVTGMIGWILEQAGEDPTVVNGAPVINWMSADRLGNFRGGRSDLWVIEADESDRTLLKFSPEYAVITNASKDHFGEAETLDIFGRFQKQVSREVVNGLADPAWLRDFAPQVGPGGSRFTYHGTEFLVNMPGRHNAENALFAVVLCETVGVALPDIQRALPGFRGIHRRLERVGQARGVTVIDDYAHNPAKIRAAWQTMRSLHGRVLGVWRPHGYGPLGAMMLELAATLAEVCTGSDRLHILPVFDVGGTANRSVRPEQLVERLASENVPAVFAADVPALIRDIAASARAGDCVLIMGARDPELPMIARRVLEAMAGK